MDAGPLVALIHRDDVHHLACKRALEELKGPLVTVDAVLVEAMYLLGFSWAAQDALWEMLATGLRVLAWGEADHPRTRELMKKYRDLPMDLADAALVRVAEREGIRRIFTTDRRDFSVYRPRHVKAFELLPSR